MNPISEVPLSADERLAFVRDAVAHFQLSLLRYATRISGDADRARDIVQDTFVRLMEQSPSVVEEKLPEWLFTVCRHRAFDVHRKEGRMKTHQDRVIEHLVATEPRPSKRIEIREAHAALQLLVQKLPANQQEVIRLKFQEGFSYKQISRITSLSTSHVGVLIHTAMKSLRTQRSALAAAHQ